MPPLQDCAGMTTAPAPRKLTVMTTINDLVLVHLDRKPAFYSRINDINPDVKRGWYQVELLVLSLPPQTLVWILEDAHLNGEEFTMGGRPVKLELIPPKDLPEPGSPTPEKKAKIIPLVRKT
jgi:hypothetical protein